jgi:hypothetical protein
MTKLACLLAAPLALAACGRSAPDPAPGATPSAMASAMPSERVDTVAPPRGDPDAAAATGNATPAAAVASERPYLGRWIGVEGMFLNVTPRTGGGVTMEMQWDLDHRGTFEGSVTAEGLRFTRNGVAEVAVPGTGDQTGLKWLAGKKDCLIVKPGEGYCRK